MQAIVLTKYGERGVLKLQEVSKPVPKDNEVLLKVHATTVNDWDWCFMRGKPVVYRLFMGLWKPKVTILGAEVAGRVEGAGAGVQRIKPGDAVYGDISGTGFGGFAEYVCVRESALVPKPECMTFEEAASIPHAFALARQGLVDEGRIQEGQRVLINGAGGGVGNFGVQLAKHYGAETTGVDSGAKLETMREMVSTTSSTTDRKTSPKAANATTSFSTPRRTGRRAATAGCSSPTEPTRRSVASCRGFCRFWRRDFIIAR